MIGVIPTEMLDPAATGSASPANRYAIVAPAGTWIDV
jgi:hypothetical protein